MTTSESSTVLGGLMMRTPLLVRSIAERAGQLFAEREIVSVTSTGVERSSWGEVVERARRLASALHELGIRPGDRVGTFGWNSVRHLERRASPSSIPTGPLIGRAPAVRRLGRAREPDSPLRRALRRADHSGLGDDRDKSGGLDVPRSSGRPRGARDHGPPGARWGTRDLRRGAQAGGQA